MTSAMEEAILANPCNVELYVPLFDVLAQSEDSNSREKLQQYTAMLIDNCMVPREMWHKIAEGERLISSDECKKVFEVVIKHYPDFQIVSGLLDKAIILAEEEKMTAEELRGLFELSIVACGSDVFTGSEIWRKFREYEVDEHEDLVETEAPASDLQKSKERFIKIYLRQLSLPLVGNEDTLKEFETKLAEFCVESDLTLVKPAELEKKISAGKEMREGRLLYEMHIFSDKYPNNSVQQKETFWQGYIEYEKKQNQVSRAQRLYERAVIECPESFILWLDFVEFALTTLKNWTLLSTVTQRALKLPALRSSAYLWKLRILSAECGGTVGIVTKDDVNNVFQKALGAGLRSVEDFLGLYLSYTDYHRRKLAIDFERCSKKVDELQQNGGILNVEDEQNLTQGLQHVRESLETTLAFMRTYGSQWLAGWWRVCKHHSMIEHTLIGNVDDFLVSFGTANVGKASGDSAAALVSFSSRKEVPEKKAKTIVKHLNGSEVWDTTVKLFPTSYFLWSEYVAWARSVGAVEHCRKIYRKLTNLTLDVPSAEICQDWVRFEEQYGSITDLQVALSRRFSHERSIVIATVAEQCATTSVDSSHMEIPQQDYTAPTSRDRKRKLPSADLSSSVAVPSATAETVSTPFQAVTGSIDDADDIQASKKIKETFEKHDAETMCLPIKPEEPQLSSVTVVVSNFPFAASLDTIRPMLLDKCQEVHQEASVHAQDGEKIVVQPAEVMDMRLILTKAGHSRGMVEVDFPEVSCQLEEGREQALVCRRAFLQMIVDKLNGYEYNGRPLKAAVKSLAKQSIETIKTDPLLAQKRAGSLAAPHLTTVFVSQFAPTVTTEQLQQHFVACGEILAAKVAVDKKTRESKCTGLVQFASETGRRAALLMNKSSLLGNEISVIPSRFSLIPVAASDVIPAFANSNPTDQEEGTGSISAKVSEPSTHDSATKQTTVPAARKLPPASLAKVSNLTFKPRNVVKQAPKGKIQL